MEQFNEDQLERMTNSANKSAINESIRANNDLIAALVDSRNAVQAEVLDTIEAMTVAFDQKKEAVEKIRAFRKTVESESRDINRAVDVIFSCLTKEKIQMLRDTVEIMEKLNNIKPGDVLFSILRSSLGEGK